MADKLAKYFPEHRMRIELFFGAGGAYFNLPKPKYAILNDLDDDVTNLFLVIQQRREDLVNAVLQVPVAETLMKHWKKNPETDPVLKAVRFLLLSNFTYLGKGYNLKIGLGNEKKQILKNIDRTFEFLGDAKILNRDFREVLSTICFTKGQNDKEACFLYLDPVYLGTEHTYKVPKWGEADVIDCLDIMINCGIRSAMSEFDHPFVVAEAKKRGLNIINLGERANIKNRRTEILITNYDTHQLKLL